MSKTILKTVPKVAVAMVATATMGLAPVAVSAWGPARDIYCIEGSPIACPVSNPAGVVADHVVFNSIANNPAQGDERNFMRIKESGTIGYTDSIVLQPGKTYDVFMYYHNNASSSLNASGRGIAHGTNVRAAIPALVSNIDTKAVGYVKSNESGQVWDDITLKSANDGQIALRLVPGSAKLYNHNDGNGNATKVTTLSDKIVTAEGAAIGYNLDGNGNVKLDGVIPGCNEFAGYVVFQLFADQANFTVNKQVRINGSGADWTETVNAQPGDTVDFLIEYKNTGTTEQRDVVIKDKLPANLEYVKGSTYFFNARHTVAAGGFNATDDILGEGINVGHYMPGANVLVRFSAKVTADTSKYACGVNTLTNIGRVETKNGAKEDGASVIVNNEGCVVEVEMCEIEGKTDLRKDDEDCKEDEPVVTPPVLETPKELPKTGGVGGIVTGAIGVASVGTAVAYYVASRKRLN